MASYNKITLVGNLTRDPEIRYVDGGAKAVTKFALAINRKSKSGDEVMFLDIIAWERMGEICNQYLKKGMSVLVEGRLVVREYTSKEGEKRKAIEVVLNEMQMLGSKRDGETVGQYRQGANADSQTSRSAAPIDDESEWDQEIPF